MAFTTSGVFATFIRDALNNTASHSPALTSDTINAALFGNTGTPDKTVANTLSGYNQATSQWVAANEVTATGWPAGGLALASVSSTFTSNVYTFTAANRAGGATDTVTNAYGCLVYDNTIVTKDGLSFNYFGGPNSVTSGTFTIVWNASGIFTITV